MDPPANIFAIVTSAELRRLVGAVVGSLDIGTTSIGQRSRCVASCILAELPQQAVVRHPSPPSPRHRGVSGVRRSLTVPVLPPLPLPPGPPCGSLQKNARRVVLPCQTNAAHDAAAARMVYRSIRASIRGPTRRSGTAVRSLVQLARGASDCWSTVGSSVPGPSGVGARDYRRTVV